MKLRHPLLIRATSLVMSGVLRAWLATLSYRFTFDDAGAAPQELARHGRRAIYLFWHEMMLFPAHTHTRQRIAVLISHHADGELIAQIVRTLGGRVVRGSTNKRGLSALRELMRRGRVGHLAITPDGPRGPRRQVQDGCVYLASRTGMPLVPVGFAFAHCWRYRRSWDRMAFPKLGTNAQAVVGAPIGVPPGLDRAGLDQYRARVQSALDDAQSRAEDIVGPRGGARGSCRAMEG